MKDTSKIFNGLFWTAILCGCLAACTGCTQEQRDALGEAFNTPHPALDDKSPSQTLQDKVPEVITNPFDIEAWLKIAGTVAVLAAAGTKKGRAATVAVAKAAARTVRRKKNDNPPLPPL